MQRTITFHVGVVLRIIYRISHERATNHTSTNTEGRTGRHAAHAGAAFPSAVLLRVVALLAVGSVSAVRGAGPVAVSLGGTVVVLGRVVAVALRGVRGAGRGRTVAVLGRGGTVAAAAVVSARGLGRAGFAEQFAEEPALAFAARLVARELLLLLLIRTGRTSSGAGLLVVGLLRGGLGPRPGVFLLLQLARQPGVFFFLVGLGRAAARVVVVVAAVVILEVRVDLGVGGGRGAVGRGRVAGGRVGGRTGVFGKSGGGGLVPLRLLGVKIYVEPDAGRFLLVSFWEKCLVLISYS